MCDSGSRIAIEKSTESVAGSVVAEVIPSHIAACRFK